jgi:conjugative relaxase-like TrwC/TraI family protein
MIRKHWHKSAAACKSYFQVSDYHAQVKGEWFGRDAERLGLVGEACKEDFEKLLDNLNPQNGEHLTKYTRDGRRVALELTFNAVKDGSLAGELGGPVNEGDPLVQRAHKQAVRKVLAFLEPHMQARVRDQGDRDSKENRTTGGMIAWMGTHNETRVNSDGTPDPDKHDHVLIMNATWDRQANGGRGAWRAIECDEMVRKLPLAEALYHNEMACLLRTAGNYGIERRGKTYRLVGISDELRDSFSRRTQTINQRRKEAEKKLGRPLTAEEADQLGAKTRLGKTDMNDAELHDCYLARLTPKWKAELQRLKGRPSHICDAAAAVKYACEHEFYRHAVVSEDQLLETALRRRIGLGTLEEIKAEAVRQGVLFKDGMATTERQRQEEREICGIAREGRGKCRPVVARPFDVRQLVGESAGKAIQPSGEQESSLRRLVISRDRVNILDAGQGTGKTTLLEWYGRILARHNFRATWLATTHTAVDELKSRGLPAMTVAHFLASKDEQRQAVGSRIILDESSMLAHRDGYELMKYVSANGCRIDYVGDNKQYKTPSAGNPVGLLVRFGGIAPITMTKTMRQTGRLKDAMEAIRDGDVLKGHDILTELGMVHEIPLDQLTQKAADRYLEWSAKGKAVPVISPTWAQADDIAARIRVGLRERGNLTGEDRTVRRLVNLNWSPAQIEDARENGVEDGVVLLRYGAYREETQSLAAGDLVKTTMGGKTKDGRHALRNGRKFRIAGFTRSGDPILDNGAVVDKNWGGLVQRYVSTGQGSQGITADPRAIVVYGTPSLVATRQEGFYVPVSRVRTEVAVLTDNIAALRRAIQRKDNRTSAMELFEARERQKASMRQRLKKHLGWMRRRLAFERRHQRSLPGPELTPPRTPTQRKEHGYGLSR